MSQFLPCYMTAFYIGEGLSGLLPALIAFIQGAGEYTCVMNSNGTGNSTENSIEFLQPQYANLLFPVKDFFITLFIMLLLSLGAFIFLKHSRYCKSEYRSIPVTGDTVAHRACQYKDNDENPSNGDHLAMVDNCSRQGQTTDKSYFITLLLIISFINALSNGVLPSIQTYSLLPYGHIYYRLALITHHLKSLKLSHHPIGVLVIYYIVLNSRWLHYQNPGIAVELCQIMVHLCKCISSRVVYVQAILKISTVYVKKFVKLHWTHSVLTALLTLLLFVHAYTHGHIYYTDNLGNTLITNEFVKKTIWLPTRSYLQHNLTFCFLHPFHFLSPSSLTPSLCILSILLSILSILFCSCSLGVKLSALANPLACFIAFATVPKKKFIVYGLTGVVAITAVYIIIIASYSPQPPVHGAFTGILMVCLSVCPMLCFSGQLTSGSQCYLYDHYYVIYMIIAV